MALLAEGDYVVGKGLGVAVGVDRHPESVVLATVPGDAVSG